MVICGIQVGYRCDTDGIFSDAVGIGDVCEWYKIGDTGEVGGYKDTEYSIQMV